ncbi:nucleoside recognition protein [Rhodobacteraceae bacterium RKSG542]|nr:nucleoside recognition protein [Pseudovibrio flavus]
MVKTMVPVMIAVRVATELGVVDYLAIALKPIMGLVGLPAELGLALASGLLINIYAAIAVFVGLLPTLELTVADSTILLSILLIAHAIPLEQMISRSAGVSFVFSSTLRIVIGLLYGMTLNFIYSAGGWLQEPLDLKWLPFEPKVNETWLEWAYGSGTLLFTMFWIILGLIIFLKVLEVLKITDFLNKLLAPLLGIMGISKEATSITMVGVLLGLSYGGGLIIREAQAGKLQPRDVVLSLCFMGICHGLIEDPLVMIAFGGHWSGVLVGRFIFCVLAMALVSRVVLMMPEDAFRKYLYRPSNTAPAAA